MNTKKIEKSKLKREKNKSEQLLEQNFSGKLIEENHNGYDYSNLFTIRAVSWYLGNLYMKTKKYNNDSEKFGLFFRSFKHKFQTLVLHWPVTLKRDWTFWFMVDILDLYRDNKTNKEFGKIMLDYCKSKLSFIK